MSEQKATAFEEDYKKLIIFTEYHVKDKGLRVDAADLVNAAFLKFHESGKPYLISEIRQYIISASFNELWHQTRNVNEEWKPYVKETSSHCKKCGDEKPIAGFYLSDILTPSTYCKKCYIEIQLENYNKNKEIWLIRSAEYKEKNKDAIKKRKHNYYLENRVLKPRIKKEKAVKIKGKPGRPKSAVTVVRKKRKFDTPEEKRLKWNAYMNKRRKQAKDEAANGDKS